MGGDGQDSMFGYGSRDILGGGRDRDKMRGAFGNDDLTDTVGDGDNDKACDGYGNDLIDFDDLDGDDHFHWTGHDEPGGSNDLYGRDQGDTVDRHGDCPSGMD